jgi:glycosyltransferase involved in cell wall biosynthesis
MKIEDFKNNFYDPVKIKREMDISPSDFVFGYVGRIVGDKGINELVKAFTTVHQKYPNTKLLLVGWYEKDLDPLKKITYQKIKNNSSIIEMGYQKDVQKYLSVLDIFVSPSYREGFGISLLEANLMGKPVIASCITGYSEIVEEGCNGFLIPKKNLQALTDKMEWAINNPDVLKKMKEDCRGIIQKKYDHKKVLEEAVNYYINLN